MPTSLPACWLLTARLLLVLLGLLPRLATAQTPPTFDMAKRVIAPIPGIGSRPFSHDVAVDAAGNSYVSGYFSGSINFGATTVAANSGDLFVAKIDAAGNHRWIVAIKAGQNINNGSTINTRLAVDAGGNVYVAGNFVTPTLTLGNTTLNNAGGADLFVGKLDANGNWLSAIRAGGPGNESVGSLALDGSGTVYLAGQFTGTSIFGSTVMVSAGQQDFFLGRLDTNGSWRWAVRGGSSGQEWSSDVRLDANGFAYLSSRFDTGGQFGPFTLPANSTFVAKIDAATGTCQRVTSVVGISYFYYGHLAVAADGSCYLSGSFRGTVSFGNFTLTSVGAGLSGVDVFVAKIDTAGIWQWVNTAGGTSDDNSRGIAVDARSNTYITGTFQGPNSRFGSVTLMQQNPGFASDVFVAKLDANGSWLWAVPAGGLQEDQSTGLALGPFDTPYIVGEYFSPAMTFGSITIPGEPSFLASTFVARMQPNRLRISGDSVLCNGGSTQLTASTFTTGPVGYRWSTGATTASIAVGQPGTYSVTATFAGGYSLTEQFRVRSIAPVVQITGGGGFLCPGTSRQLTAVALGATGVRWSTGATTASISVTQPGTYSVVATYSSACTATAQVILANNELRISGRLQLCPGQSTTLTASTAGSPVTGYLWNTGATTPTLLVGQAGTFRVTASLADGCQLTTTHTVGPPVAKVASVSGDTLLCPGTRLTLTALNPDALTYQWTTGATTPTITIAQPGRYGVLLTYTGGCTSRDSLLVRSAPVAPTFTLGPDTTLCLEQPLLLRAPAFDGPGVRRRWSDGSTGPTLLVSEPGTYSLQITTLCDSRTVSRRVDYVSCLRIPNVITPNNDQRNDRFVVEGLTRGDWALTLYNRWGAQVYHSSAYRHDWGRDAAPGTYYYLLRQATTNVTYKGWLEVIR